LTGACRLSLKISRYGVDGNEDHLSSGRRHASGTTPGGSGTSYRGMEMAEQGSGKSVTMGTEDRRTATSLGGCALEPWGTVRRRIRILVDEMGDMDPALHVLYVAPAVDIPHELRRGRIRGISGPRLEQVHPRIHVLRPRKWLPRAVGPFADRALARQVLHAASGLGLLQPLLWINDASYAQFSVDAGWPSIYDITDDWLLAPP